MTYHEFLESKMVIAPESGVEIDPGEVNPALKPHQRDAVVWALRGGKRALFESFGLGKTVQELEFCRLAVAHESGYALIVLPLGVRQEFARDAVRLLGWPSAPAYVRTMEEARQVMRRVEAQETAEDGCTAGACRVMMTNYERVRDGDMDPEAFTATSLDEASVLRSFGSKTYQTFLDKFRGVRYKLVSTATPSPNRYKELIHYAGYLDVEGKLPSTFMVVAPGSWTEEVWDDVNRMRTLNSEQVRNGRQMHVCPLQLDIVDRLINRYSAPGETVFDPFGGLMTVPVEAVRLGREGIGTELNADYCRSRNRQQKGQGDPESGLDHGNCAKRRENQHASFHEGEPARHHG